jgi:hypothetical protein
MDWLPLAISAASAVAAGYGALLWRIHDSQVRRLDELAGTLTRLADQQASSARELLQYQARAAEQFADRTMLLEHVGRLTCQIERVADQCCPRRNP